MTRDFAIIGFGKVGSILAKALDKRERLSVIVCRTPDNLQKTFSKKIHIYKSLNEIKNLPNNIIICVNDDEISNVSIELANIFKNTLNGKHIIHTSGIKSPYVLESCKKYDAIIGSAHPYQTFYSNHISFLKGIAWGIESDDFELTSSIVNLLEGIPFDLKKIKNFNRAKYHSSAVFVSNYLTLIISISKAITQSTGLPSDLFLKPIIKTTVKNNLKYLNSNEIPLTGPITRGDIQTVKEHVESLREDLDILRAYTLIGSLLAETAQKYGLIDHDSFQELQNILLTYKND